MAKHNRAAPAAGNVEAQAAAARRARAQACEREIQALLSRYGCALQVVQVWTNGAPGPVQVQVVPVAQQVPVGVEPQGET